jgi:trimeric autotransporter adhesin
VGADVGYRVKADTVVANALKITQATAGALTVTVDIDETDEATTTATGADAAVNATNATSLKAVFDSTFVGDVKAAGDNIAALSITAAEAKSLTVESGGTVDYNQVNVVSAAKLESITVTGAAKANIDVTTAAKLASIDASAATGGLVVSTDVFDGLTTAGGTIKLGTGADVVTVTVNTATTVDSLVGFEKAAAAAIGTDAAAAEAAIKAADLLTFGGAAAVADATTGVTGGNVNDKGVLVFSGSGPASLDAALTIAAAASAAGEVLVFEYVGDTYVYANGSGFVELTGVTGVTNLVEGTAGLVDHFAIV